MRRLLAALLFAAALPAAAQYPSKPVRLVNPFPPGGPLDLMGRLLSDRLGTALGKPVIVENKPGAAGNIGAAEVARAAPDGHTALLTLFSIITSNPHLYDRLPFDPLKDFAPVVAIATSDSVLIVHPSVPAQSVRELIAYAKQNPGKVNYASAGKASPGHLTAEYFARQAGVQMTHVPYKGIQAIAPDIVSGEVHVVFNAFGPLNAFVQAGKVKLLAVTSAERLPAYPDVPSLSESALPGFDATGWYVLFAPAGTPRPVLERLNAELRSALADRDTVQKIEKAGMRPVAQTLDEAARFMTAETDKWGRAVRASGAAAE